MSWLFVAFVPGLLMLATFGLGRLEAGLDVDTVSPTDVVEFLEQAKAVCAKPAARTNDTTYPLIEDDYVDVYRKRVIDASPKVLPVRVLIPRDANPEFQPTRHSFRV